MQVIQRERDLGCVEFRYWVGEALYVREGKGEASVRGGNRQEEKRYGYGYGYGVGVGVGVGGIVRWMGGGEETLPAIRNTQVHAFAQHDIPTSNTATPIPGMERR